METQQPDRRALGREEFVRRVWAWKEESGGAIVNQLKRLGASCDWSRERFTMDEGLSRAVLKVFVDLYNEGLIYRDKRLVNWDPHFQTAISDLEVQQVEVKGHLWHIRYPIEGEPGRFITVATTRPETMLGDSRHRGASGRRALPRPRRAARDPAAGEPPHPDRRRRVLRPGEGHRRGQDHPGARLQRFRGRATARAQADQHLRAGRSASARRNDPSSWPRPTPAPEVLALDGLDRFEARKRVVALLEAGRRAGEGRAEPPHRSARRPLGRGDRALPHRPVVRRRQAHGRAGAGGRARRARPASCPSPGRRPTSSGWRTSSPGASRASSGGATRSRPGTTRTATSTSRSSEEEASAAAREKHGREVELRRDPDVLDTWFSSALWPFSTLGWPDETPELAALLPDEHARHRLRHHLLLGRPDDDDGPALHGPRALRHRLHPRARARRARGQDVEVEGQRHRPARPDRAPTAPTPCASPSRPRPRRGATSGSRSSASRATATSRPRSGTPPASPRCTAASASRATTREAASLALNRWALGEAARAAAEVTAAIEEYRFNEAAAAAYRFTWGVFCDWYLELAKPVLQGPDGPEKDETRATIAYLLDEICKLLHPFMPFLTEELWAIKGAEGPAARNASWRWRPGPRSTGSATRRPRRRSAGWSTSWRRSAPRARRRTSRPARRSRSRCVSPSPETRARLEALGRHDPAHGAPVRRSRRSRRRRRSSVQLLVRGEVAALPLEGIVDLAAERARLRKDRERLARRGRQDRREARQPGLRLPRPRGGGGGAARAARGGARPHRQDRRGPGQAWPGGVRAEPAGPPATCGRRLVSAFHDRFAARAPFTDPEGRKGFWEPFTRAPRHRVTRYTLALDGVGAPALDGGAARRPPCRGARRRLSRATGRSSPRRTRCGRTSCCCSATT